MVYRLLIAIGVLAAGATAWNAIDAFNAYSVTENVNRAARADWQKDIAKTRQSIKDLRVSVNWDTLVASGTEKRAARRTG